MPKSKKATKLCYVIMPFSDTDSCRAGQWTMIFNGLIKPAVEEAGLGYTCVRSKARTGNIIKKIVQDLYSANVVIADLTDKKPNVFYELGVRHTLRHRTILIAQSRDDISSDLDGYASHEYNWNTEPGQEQFRANIRDSLQHIEEDPDRSDNPVSDFLHERSIRIFEFQREENTRKLSALIGEIRHIKSLLEQEARQEGKDTNGDHNVFVFQRACPALDHLIATQYVESGTFTSQLADMRSSLELFGGNWVSERSVSEMVGRVDILERNAMKVFAAYTSGSSLDALELEILPDWSISLAPR